MHNIEVNQFLAFSELNRKSEKHPNFTGTINIDGEERRIAIWVKKGSTGKAFLTGQLSVKETKVEDLLGDDLIEG